MATVATQQGKKMVIDLNYDIPKFTFEGEWTGKDIIITRNLMRREYLRHQQHIRRDAMVTQN